jgi:DNA replication and repair protein RecF
MAYRELYLKSLQLTNFKNYSQAQLDLSAKINCFVGDNGMGKTNLLDAIHTICLAKSHFLFSQEPFPNRAGESVSRLVPT